MLAPVKAMDTVLRDAGSQTRWKTCWMLHWKPHQSTGTEFTWTYRFYL